jgi:hypothetical protein
MLAKYSCMAFSSNNNCLSVYLINWDRIVMFFCLDDSLQASPLPGGGVEFLLLVRRG